MVSLSSWSMKNSYKYSNRAVAFLDVLGFQNKLKDFEEEAICYYNNHSGYDGEDDGVDDVSDVEAGMVAICSHPGTLANGLRKARPPKVSGQGGKGQR